MTTPPSTTPDTYRGITMTTTQPDTTTTQADGAATVAMTFEVTTLPVADVDRAKAF